MTNPTSQQETEPMVDIYSFKCSNGHEFIDVCPAGEGSFYCYARSKDNRPDKPQGGICCQCNGSIYVVKIEHGVVQKVTR